MNKRKANTRLSFPLAGLLMVMMVFTVKANKVSEEDHHAFEQKFAKACVEQEKTKLKGSGVYLAEVEAVCACIAREESERLTSEEVKEYMIDERTPISLIMKKNAAANVCIEEKNKAQ